MDSTHDPGLRSWVESANEPGCDFPIQNLPFGVFRRKGAREAPRAGVAIGDRILDLAALGVRGPALNGLAAMGRPAWRRLRRSLSRGLALKTRDKRWARHLVEMKKAELLLPVAVGDYSDFYAGIHHATSMGRLLRPDNPLLPNYKWAPIAYHGRASSIVVSGTPIARPKGQLKPPDAPHPVFAASRRLDYEAELGFVVGPGNAPGRPIPVERALEHVFGVVLLNDWSARDIQAWEYQPLGPFLGKSFASTVSPWIVTLEALEPYRCPAFARAAGSRLHHVKCHGALYNMAANDEALSEAMVRAARDLGAMLYVLSNSRNHQIARQAGIRVAGEVFADRGYSDDGTLAPRDRPGGMIEDAARAVTQALAMVEEGYVTSLSGKRVPVSADTLCLHGDQPGAAAFASRIREAFSERGIRIAAP